MYDYGSTDKLLPIKGHGQRTKWKKEFLNQI